MLRDAILYDTVPDVKKASGIENVCYFDYCCKINGKRNNIRLTIKKALNDDVRFFYYFKLNVAN
jgi:hypothetical protein